MESNKLRTVRRMRRKRGIRKNLFGSTERPRMTIYRSNKNIYAQVINDIDGKTLVSASSAKLESGGNIEAAKAVGTAIAEAAKAQGISDVAFDRNGYLYHGRIKALADAAREAGLNF